MITENNLTVNQATENSEKTYRVVFRKNNGLGKRTRIVMKASNLEDLTESIKTVAKSERLRPMRIQEIKDSLIVNKFRIKVNGADLDIIQAKERKSPKSTITNNSESNEDYNQKTAIIFSDDDDDESEVKHEKECNYNYNENGDLTFDVE